MKYYFVCDKVARQIGPLFGAKNDEVAKRMIKNMWKDEKSDPSEYSLVSVVSIDEDLIDIGEIDSSELLLNSIREPNLKLKCICFNLNDVINIDITPKEVKE